MPVGLLGRKVGMTQLFDAAGVVTPVTVIEAGPCTVRLVRTLDRDGYEAMQLGFGQKPKRVLGGGDGSTKPQAGDRFVREIRGKSSAEVGQVLNVDVFKSIPVVDVIGVSKGRGFAGVMKRHNFGGVCASHGVKKVHRSGGSTGQSTDPGRVFKGTKMPGRMGGVRVTVRGLRVREIFESSSCVAVAGSVPGPVGGFVMVRETNCR